MNLKFKILILGLGITITGCTAFPELEEAVTFSESQAGITEFLSPDALENITADMDHRRQDDYSAKLKALRNKAGKLRDQDLSNN
jgi:hypothetical protein